MKPIRDISELFQAKEVVLGEAECDCGEIVEHVETIVPIGPKKGEKMVYKRGCKCEEIEMARKLRMKHEELQAKKFSKLFAEESLINNDLIDATFRNYIPYNEEQKNARKELAHFAHNFNPDKPVTYILTGPFGVGKSHLAYATCKHILQESEKRMMAGEGRGHSVLFLSVPKLLTKIQSTYNKNSDVSEDDLLNYIAKVDLLVLDDIGAEYKSTSKWTQSKLFEIVDSRVGRSTIYTTNSDVSEFNAVFGARIASRMQRQSYLLELDGTDQRKATAKVGGQYIQGGNDNA